MSEQIITKRCSKCNHSKPISEFHKDRSRKDGLKVWCKSCRKAYQQSERGRAVSRKAVAKNQHTPNGKAVHRKAVAKYRRTPKGKAVKRKSIAKYYAHHPNYVRAINAVNHAIHAGKLPRPDSLPCHYCPAQAQEYHHYRGYEPEHWLDVIPLCRICHANIHKVAAQ